MAQRYTNMRDILYQIREGYSPKEIKMAIGIANDPRYKGGNYSGAVDQIEKIKKGLSQHKQVAAVLKRLNTDFDPEIVDEEVELDEKVEYVEYKFRNRNDAMKAKQYFDGIQLMSFDINDDDITNGELYVDAGNKDMTKYHNEVMKKFRPKVLTQEELDLDEMKMDDPKLVKAFDKMKKGDTIKLKTSSTISKGKDFVDYVVKAKNVVNKGRVEKITLVTKGNEKAVKKFLYKRDGKVTFAIGDMGASIDDIKEEQKEPIQWPSQPLEEMREPYAVVDTADGNKVVGTASDEKGAKSIITTSELPPMKIKDKKTLKIVKVKKKQMIGQPIKEEEEPNKPDSAKEVEQGRDDKKKTRIAQLQLQIAKATETINKLNAQEK